MRPDRAIRLSILLSAGLLQSAALSRASLSGEETSLIAKCRDNVSGGQAVLSPEIAQDCVKKFGADGSALLKKLKDELPAEAAAVLSRNNALSDLRTVINSYSGPDLTAALKRVLEEPPCPLCEMGIGPEDAKLLAWVRWNAADRLGETEEAALRWDKLGEIRRKALASGTFRYTEEKWSKRTISERDRMLTRWAQIETDRLVAANLARKACLKQDPELIRILRGQLSGDKNKEYARKLDLLAGPEEAWTDPKKLSSLEKRAGELLDAQRRADKLKDKPESDQAAYLNETFDRTAAGAGGDAGPESAKKDGFYPKKLSVAQTKKLAGRLLTAGKDGELKGPIADEMRGTKAGEEILAFYKDEAFSSAGSNRLNFAFAKAKPSEFGYWDPEKKVLVFNSVLVNKWMKENRTAPARLFSDDPAGRGALVELARYLTPTFVHEATHQRQSARAKAAKVNYSDDSAPYQMEDETEAFSMDASYTTEKLLKAGPAYTVKLHPFDRQSARLFLEKGVAALRTDYHAGYTDIDSIEGSASKEFREARDAAKRLQELEGRYRTAPGKMSAGELRSMISLKKTMETRFRWYTLEYAGSAANEAKFNEWRQEINSRLYPPATPATGAPPEPQ